MEEALRAIQHQLAELATTNQYLVTRMDALEAGGGGGEETKTVGESVDQLKSEPVVNRMGAREKSLNLTFGDGGDHSSTSLRLFIDHYDLAKAQNQERGVEGWNSPRFRARELRFQLRGEPALWISHESAMAKEWTADDEEIIERLKLRYLGTQSLELNIVLFEEISQNEGEPLTSYMTRCQERGLEAYAGLDEPCSTQQRIVWKFLSGIRDPAVRTEVIKEKWMKSPKEAKSYDEVLLIAEQAKVNKMATVATGSNSGGKKEEDFRANHVSKVKERRKGAPNLRLRNTSGESGSSSVPQTPSPSPRSSRSSYGYRSGTPSDASRSGTPSDASEKGGGRDSGNFLCHYCKTRSHFGGWKACAKRQREAPDWKPSVF